MRGRNQVSEPVFWRFITSKKEPESAGLPPLKRRTKKVNWIPLPDPLTEPRRIERQTVPIGFSDATGQIGSISYNSAFDTRITRVPPSRTPPTPACERFRTACLTACVPLLRRAVSTPRKNVNTCPLRNFGRVIAELFLGDLSAILSL
jgi:hypothetical protein